MSGRIAETDLDEVRKKSSIVDVASQYMKVRQAGRQFKALCPFHAEKTPSFTIDPAKGLFYCHGCSKGGDVITLVRELESMQFVEAVEFLARRAGITIHYEQLSAAEREKSRARNRLIDAHREAVTFYHDALLKSSEAKPARDYLTGRKLSKESVEHFKVGFAPKDRAALVKHLKAKGFRDDELVAASLAIRTENGPVIDRFRGRVMFPIFDVTGEPRAFGARKLGDDEDGPKYLNSSESPIYKKGSLLYALNWAKAGIVKDDGAVIVEGYTDVIALHQEGIPIAVATCGTALGAEHFAALSRFSRRVLIALDSDQAGQAATERFLEQPFLDAQDRDTNLRVLELPAGADPASFVTEHGGDAFRAVMEATVPVVQYRLRARLANQNVDEPEGQARALRACLPVLAQVTDEAVRREYTRWVADQTRLDYDLVFQETARALGGAQPPGPAGLKKTSTQMRREEEAIKIALQHDALAAEFVAGLEPGDFTLPKHRQAWELVRAGGADPGSAPEPLRELLTRLSISPVEGLSDNEEEPERRLVEEIFQRLEESALVRKISGVRSRLEKLNPVADPSGYDALWKELVGLEAARRRLTAEPQGV